MKYMFCILHVFSEGYMLCILHVLPEGKERVSLEALAKKDVVHEDSFFHDTSSFVSSSI